MTLLDVVFKYGTPPGEKEMGALNNAWEVYGVRKIKFDEKEHTIRVEYDASRLSDGEIAAIARGNRPSDRHFSGAPDWTGVAFEIDVQQRIPFFAH